MSKRFLVTAVLLALIVMATPSRSSAAIILSIGIAPPPLFVYEQPVCPGVGYIWTPGYWAYDDVNGYFWVPGTWVLAPEPGLLWTPGWWGWSGAVFVFHEGYWGPHVGFYGGINYGFGYIGVGYEGGYWRNGAFFYNRSVNNVVNITNVYNKTVIVNNVRVAYNGGQGGLTARATAQEEEWAHERHVAATSVQAEHVRTASTNRELFQSVNHGRPAIAATPRPGEFSGGARPENAPRPEGRPVTHANEITPRQYTPPNTGNAKLDQRYQQQQQKLQAQQETERRNLQQKQEQEHQRLDQQHASAQQRQQVEQKHQQQTQQLAQRHEQQQHQLEQKQQRKR